MAHTAGNTVKENQTLWSAIPRFVTLDENLNTALANLDSADKEAKIITTGTIDGGTLPEVVCTAEAPETSKNYIYDYLYYLENYNGNGNQKAIYSIATDEALTGGEYNPSPQIDNLPSYSLISKPFATVAKLDVKAVCELIGGKVLWNYQNISSFKNACAIRLSYVFNKTEDNKIPYSSDKTVSGSDNNWYFYKVSDMATYLINTYGTPIPTTTANIKGKKGIIWQSECGWGDASGHLDVWNGTNALDHFYTECDNIYFWELF